MAAEVNVTVQKKLVSRSRGVCSLTAAGVHQTTEEAQ